MPAPTLGLAPDSSFAARQLHGIQERAGNRAAIQAIGMGRIESLAGASAELPSPIQRVAIPVNFSEILQDDPASSSTNQSTYVPGSYGQSSAFQLTRTANQVNVLVRIKFHDPSGSAIPDGDARRTFGNSICGSLVGHWNRKFVLVAPMHDPVAGASPPAGTPATVRLPIHFAARPVWEADGEGDADVNLHSIPANPTAGNPIDSANWYSNTGTAYGTTPPDAIYAHEYGHLLGIPDEYSQGNADMHLRLHAISGRGGEMGKALDSAGNRQIILDAIQPHLRRAIGNVSTAAAEAFRTQRTVARTQLAGALRGAWRDPLTSGTIIGALAPHLATQPRLLRMLPEVVRFQARQNLGYGGIAGDALDTQLSDSAIATLLRSTFNQAITAAIAGGSTVTIPIPEGGSVDVRIDTRGVSGADPLLETAARTAATAAVGTATPTTPGTARRPAVYPSDTLIGELAAMPSRWRGVAGLFSTQAAALPGQLAAAAATQAAAAPPTATTVRDLYRDVRALVQSIAAGTARSTVDGFLSMQIRPMIDNQINEILSLAGTEPSRHTTVPLGGGTSGAPAPPDPALLLATTGMLARAQTMQKAPAGVGATGIHVRYTINSMMGDTNVGTDVRVDYMSGIASQVNSNFRQPGEGTFEPRRGSA
jgi:hypothetical protein